MQTLEPINPPFRTDAPPWYNNGIWGQLGCAVPQTGRYLHTQNIAIYELVDIAGRQLFHTLWHYDDRKFESPPSKNCLWEVYQLLTVARKRLVDRTIPLAESAPMATHAKPALQMFRLYPIPFYGRLGCINPFLHESAEFALLMLTEAMQHSDNERAYYVTPAFAAAVSPYLQSVMISLATRFFNYSRQEASDPAFVIPEDKWKTYNPLLYTVPVEGTSTRPPIGWTPTEEDLEPIRGIPANEVIPFLQPWPSSQLEYSSGGVWSKERATGASATVQPGFTMPPGPP